MTLPLCLRRRWWRAFTVVFAAFGVPFSVAAPLLLLSAATDGRGGTAIAGAISAVVGTVFMSVAIDTGRIARSRPRIDVEDSAIVIHHSGVFRSPLRLGRGDIHSIYVGDLFDVASQQRQASGVGQKRRAANRAFNVRSAVRSWYAPDLSLRWVDDSNIAIVLADAMPLRSVSRRTLGLVNFFSRGNRVYYGPTRWTIARGFFARVDDLALARATFASWPCRSNPGGDVWEWLRGPQGKLRF